MNETGMVKLIHSAAFDDTVDVGMRMVEDPAILTKSASTVFDCEYDELAPDKDHVGVHVVALGDFEHFGANRNADGFPKKACVDFHDTFVKSGNLYRHHRNKDASKRLGQIVKSAYNDTMGRIELFVHAHKEKARDELEKLARDGDLPFSMACKVAFDRCSRCGTLRRSSRDPNQCDHVANELGKVADDGTVTCTQNDRPKFFDISAVTRPADRIAWHLKIASGEIADSVKLAEAAGIWVPDHVAIESADSLQKLAYLKQAAELEEVYARLSGQVASKTPVERYVWELRKAAAADVDTEALDQLRSYEPKDVFLKLAKHGIILDVTSFFKYAMGPDYSEVEPYMDGVQGATRRIYSRLLKESECQEVCNNGTFDVDSRSYRSLTVLDEPVHKIASAISFTGTSVDQRIIDNTINEFKYEIEVDKLTKIGSNCSQTIELLAEKYAAYKLSAIKAIAELNNDTDTDALIALAVAQNVIN